MYRILAEILLRENNIGRSREHFWVIGLSAENKLLFIELAALGSGNKFLLDPKEVFQLAVHKQATYVILAHNHPGDELDPSDSDKDLTDHLIHAAEILNLEVAEHMILNERSYYSFLEEGLIEELGKSKKYAAYFIEEEKIMKIGKKEEKIEIAKKSLEEGLSTELIAKLTGLTKKEIKKLK